VPIERWLVERADISARLGLRKGVRQRGEWLDHHCLFHDDTHRSASWNEEHGTYYCRTEDKTYPVPDVLRVLNMSNRERRQQIGLERPRAKRDLPVKLPDHIFTYVFPDGRPSHMKWRWDDPKRFGQYGLDGSPGLPLDSWPIYGDYDLAQGLHILVVEGEKCVDRVAELDDALDQIPIRALSAGSAADLRNHAVEIAARLGELHPKSICLWPDNDEPGLAAMRAVHSALQKQGLVHATIQPASLGLPLKGDLVDYADQGNSLATVLARQTGALESEPVRELVLKTLVSRDGRVAFPDTRDFVTINEEWGRAIWKEAYNVLPSQNQLQNFLADLRLKSRQSPLTISPRVYTNEQTTWWRPNSGPAIKIAAEGLSLSEDPSDVFLLTPDDGRHVDASVDLGGSGRDLEELLSPWYLTDGEIASITGWLVCAMGGLQTPILAVKSPAGTGKTTLARFLVSVIEPMCPELRTRQLSDERHFALGLMKYPVALIDNVSRIDSEIEDTLSQLVTGYTASIRPLYTDSEVSLFLRRGIILTTISWDVYKGDLYSRMVTVKPERRTKGYFDDRFMQRRYTPLIPKVRGYVMNLLSVYYQRRSETPDPGHFRNGDLGLVLACLGYDVPGLAAEMGRARTESMVSNDARVEALVELWKDRASRWFKIPTKELYDYLRNWGITDLPPLTSKGFARWIAEKATIFADYGFQIEPYRDAKERGYKFSMVEEG
jgi:hypothetical protein